VPDGFLSARSMIDAQIQVDRERQQAKKLAAKLRTLEIGTDEI
jgi:hypothetical protein